MRPVRDAPRGFTHLNGHFIQVLEHLILAIDIIIIVDFVALEGKECLLNIPLSLLCKRNVWGVLVCREAEGRLVDVFEAALVYLKITLRNRYPVAIVAHFGRVPLHSVDEVVLLVVVALDVEGRPI